MGKLRDLRSVVQLVEEPDPGSECQRPGFHDVNGHIPFLRVIVLTVNFKIIVAAWVFHIQV